MKDKKKTQGEIDFTAQYWAGMWYVEDYGGYHWKTADEIVEEFILWLYRNGGEIKFESKITNN